MRYGGIKTPALDRVPQGRPWPPRYQLNLRKGMEVDRDGVKAAKNTLPSKAGQGTSFALTVQGGPVALKVNGKAS